MAQLVNITLDGLASLNAMRALVDPRSLDRAMRAGLSYAQKATPPAAGKAISFRYSLASARVKADVKGLAIRGDEALVRFGRRPPTVMQFRPRQNASGVAYRLYKGATVQVPHAFIGAARGRQMVLMPDRSKPYRADLRTGRRRPRAALRFVHGPSVGSIALGRSKYGDEIQREMGARINEQFAKGVQRELDRQARGFGRR